jgi:hypothetical protein
MLFAIWLMVGAAFGLACGLMAIRKNRSGTGWFLAGLLTGPVALIALFTRERREQPSFL